MMRFGSVSLNGATDRPPPSVCEHLDAETGKVICVRGREVAEAESTIRIGSRRYRRTLCPLLNEGLMAVGFVCKEMEAHAGTGGAGENQGQSFQWSRGKR